MIFGKKKLNILTFYSSILFDVRTECFLCKAKNKPLNYTEANYKFHFSYTVGCY